MASTIKASVLTAILTTIVILGGVAITDKNVYYCEATKIAMQCDSLATYYSMPNGKCNNAKIGNKLCKTGWLQITNDLVIPEPPTPTITTTAKQYLCSVEKCIPK